MSISTSHIVVSLALTLAACAADQTLTGWEESPAEEVTEVGGEEAAREADAEVDEREPTITWYRNANFQGEAHSREYARFENGACVELDWFNMSREVSSMRLEALEDNRITVAWYKGADCQGKVGGAVAPAGGTTSLPTLSWDNAIRSYRVLRNSDQGLAPGGTCFAAGEVVLTNELATLRFEQDGNLALYKRIPAEDREWLSWRTQVKGARDGSLCFEPNGNLVIYNEGGAPLWSTNTHHKGVNVLKLQSDCNLVMYNEHGAARWATGTQECWRG